MDDNRILRIYSEMEDPFKNNKNALRMNDENYILSVLTDTRVELYLPSEVKSICVSRTTGASGYSTVGASPSCTDAERDSWWTRGGAIVYIPY